MPDARGHFGPYGRMFVPETLMTALEELTAKYERAGVDPNFQRELDTLLHDFAGRPTPLCYAKRLTQKLAGAKIYLKREDLLHTGAHRINNALGQILLARRIGKGRIIAETGAGQPGVATATVAARLSTFSTLGHFHRGELSRGLPESINRRYDLAALSC